MKENKLSMITESDIQTVENIKKFIETNVVWDGNQWEEINWVDLLDRMVKNLQIAPYCYEGDYDNSTCCENCGWYGPDKFLEGGGQIADTGDYGDVYCPVCGWNFL